MKLCNKYFVVALLFAFSALSAVWAIDLDELRRRAKEYQEKSGSYGAETERIIEKKSVQQVKPENRFIETGEPMLSAGDTRFINLHMKLANRNFSKKDYVKANAELDKVFQRNPRHSGAHFMRAVISARQKQYKDSWYNISVAKEKDSGNSKINSFISKLKTVCPEPDPPVWVKGVYRCPPVYACDKFCDIIERFLKTSDSQYVSEIIVANVDDLKKASFPVTINFSPSAPSEDTLKQNFQKDSSVKINKCSSSDKSFSCSFDISDVPFLNPQKTPIKDLDDFVKSINEEIDVAISSSSENEAINGIKRVDYSIAVRNFSILNDFLRVLAPYAEKYFVQSIKLGGNPSTVIWETEVSVFYWVK